MKKISALLLAFLLLTAHLPRVSAYSSTLDTDGDDLTDAAEDQNGNNTMDGGETDPFNADTDGGGESDGSEVAGRRNPLDPSDDMTFDADGDGWVNGIEASERTDPLSQDTDNDGVIDPQDGFPLDSKYQSDLNSNHLPDDWEQQTGLSKNQATPTTVDDPDGDGLTNAEEFARGTNPLLTDSDRDGIDDKTELETDSDPKENACLSYGSGSTLFADIEGHWSQRYVTHLANTSVAPDASRIIRGYEEKGVIRFLGDRSVTRYEFLKMVMLSTCTKIRPNSEDEKTTFTDIRKDSPIGENAETAFKRKLVYSAVHYGIVAGYDDGTFRPDAPVNRAEALKILSIAAGVQGITVAEPMTFFDVTEDDWFSEHVRAASSREIVNGYPDGTFKPGNFITRAEAAKIVYLTMIGNPTINSYVLPTEN